MSAPLCTVCLDTGSKSQDIGGDPDCTSCNAADERVAVDIMVNRNHRRDRHAIAFAAYQLGKAAAAPVAADTGRDDALEQAAKICNSHAQDQSRMHQHAEMYVADFLASKIRALINNPIVTDAPVVPVAAQPVVPQEPKPRMMSDMVLEWEAHQRISDIPAVDEALRDFSDDPTGDNAVYIVREVLKAAAPSLEAQPAGEVVRDAARYRWLLTNYATGDGYRKIDAALNDGDADKYLSAAIDEAMAQGDKHGN